jgi:catechol 2,3-dioxygenase
MRSEPAEAVQPFRDIPHGSISDDARIGRVRLAVTSLQASVAFYSGVIGLQVLTEGATSAVLGVAVTGIPLVELVQQPGLRPLGKQTRLGLYHTAVLLPMLSDLASFVRHCVEHDIPFGSADHFVSEALYLVDPDGLSVEVYADRPRSEWPQLNGEIKMGIEPIDFDDLLSQSTGTWRGVPAGTTVGHMHFYVGDLKLAKQFYQDGLGFGLAAQIPAAMFWGAGGYHHHVGTNIWAARSPIASETDPRILFWELVLPSIEDRESVRSRLLNLGYVEQAEGVFRDVWGIEVHLVASP